MTSVIRQTTESETGSPSAVQATPAMPHIGRLRLGEHLAIQLDVPRDHLLDAELGPHPLAAGRAEAFGECRVGQNAVGELSHPHAIADFHEEAGLAIDDKLAIGRDVAGDDGNAGGHRFHDTVRHALEIAGEPEDVAQADEPGRVVAVAGEPHQVVALHVACQLEQVGPLWAFTDEHQIHAVGQLLEQLQGPDDVFHPLLRSQTSGKADDARAGRDIELGKDSVAVRVRVGGNLDGVGNHGQLVRRHAEVAIEIGHALRVADQTRGAADLAAIEPQLPRALPRIDAAFRDEHFGPSLFSGDQPPVRVGREDPRVQNVGPLGLR